MQTSGKNGKDDLRSPAHLLLCLSLAARVTGRVWGICCRSWASKGVFLVWLIRIDA